jgi:hypothetical protein
MDRCAEIWREIEYHGKRIESMINLVSEISYVNGNNLTEVVLPITQVRWLSKYLSGWMNPKKYELANCPLIYPIIDYYESIFGLVKISVGDSICFITEKPHMVANGL